VRARSPMPNSGTANWASTTASDATSAIATKPTVGGAASLQSV
jgi:hypothetical protein